MIELHPQRSGDDSAALQAAIDKIGSLGGGHLRLCAGHYRSGPLKLVSGLHLELEAGARLEFIPEFERYTAVKTRWEGVECYGYHPCIYGYELEAVRISGFGVLDGSGQAWWTEFRRRKSEKVSGPQLKVDHELSRLNPGYDSAGSGGGGRASQFLRPPLIQLMHCRDVVLEQFRAENSPFWNTQLVYCENVSVRGIHIYNPHDAPNGDGLSIDSSRYVRISDCHIDAGDDCLTLKSGMDADGRRVNRPVEYVSISNCTFVHGHGGVVCGSEISGGVQHIVISNCIFKGTDRGFRVKARRGRGGYVRDVRISHVVMDSVLCPIVLNSWYACGASRNSEAFSPEPQPLSELTPEFRDISISHFTARNCRASLGYISGLPERPVKGLQISHCILQTDPDAETANPVMLPSWPQTAAEGMTLQHVEEALIDQVTLHCHRGPALIQQDARFSGSIQEIPGDLPSIGYTRS